MSKVLSLQQATAKSEILQKEGKRVVLTGGCFDILHLGHIELFEKAKQYGEYLIVLLESDKKIRELKGPNRPLHTQEERAKMLSAIAYIDAIICLPYMTTNQQYDQMVLKIHPSIIAVTKGDPSITHKKRQAEKIDAVVAEVVKYIPNKSTSAAVQVIINEK